MEKFKSETVNEAHTEIKAMKMMEVKEIPHSGIIRRVLGGYVITEASGVDWVSISSVFVPTTIPQAVGLEPTDKSKPKSGE